MSSSTSSRILHPIFILPPKLLAKFREWIYGYVRLLFGMVCSVSCILCVFTFIWYLTFRGLYGFLISLQLNEPTTDDGSSDLNIDSAEYHQSGKRGSFLTRCRAQAELIQQTLKQNRTNNGDKSPNGGVKSENNGTTNHHHRCSKQHHHHHHHHHHNHSPIKENSGSGLLDFVSSNSSYVSEIFYDENGHKIGEQIYLTNDSDGLEESYFQIRMNDIHAFKELSALSTPVIEGPTNDLVIQD